MGEAQIVRINLALARIEAASLRQDGGNTNATASAEMKARHETLRAETAAALVELDALVVSQSREAS